METKAESECSNSSVELARLCGSASELRFVDTVDALIRLSQPNKANPLQHVSEVPRTPGGQSRCPRSQEGPFVDRR